MESQKVASVLFLEVEGAFPNAVTDQLIHNLRRRRVPKAHVWFIKELLTQRCTKLRFDNFSSEYFNLQNGIGQGDPLSMVLYLFYNADLLNMLKADNEMSLGFVDNVAFMAVGSTLEETHKKLRDMMERKNRAFEWAKQHNSRFEISKMALMDFTRDRIPDPAGRTKTIPIPQKSMTLQGKEITPVATCKFLGVVLDDQLRFKNHHDLALSKATTWTQQLRCLTKITGGVAPHLI